MVGNVSLAHQDPASVQFLSDPVVNYATSFSDATSRTVIIKRDLARRVDTERTLLQRFQDKPFFRPIIDEIEEPKPAR